ncbi:CIC11C00000004991 [Sungouiella intermedia]|uniref:CIC11C00000004991 n=1 Tax=Sungouiella intermedia TaxID=45354 RepID=A0A1L0DAP7_9ASCO|nr:CIC11C00000004991 [[Candida] intermedia]
MYQYLAVILLVVLSAAADSGLGCYSSVDTSVARGYKENQSSSLCAELCGSDYPYVAVKNGGYCFCLLSLPTALTSSSNCNVKCNGYGFVMCGGANAYTVFTGNGEAAGELGAVGASSAGGNSVGASSADSSTAQASASPAASATSSSTSSSSSSLPTSTSVSSSVPASSSSGSITTTPMTTNAASTSVFTTTSGENGSVIYKTVTTQASPTSSSEANNHLSSKKSTNVAPIVGGVVGGLAALALIGVGIFFFIRRRSDNDDDDEEEFYEKGSGNLNAGGGSSKSRKNRLNSVFDMPMSNPFAHPTDDFADKRLSKMTQNGGLTDPRLNPVMMGRRRLSEGSLADETDYSRKILGVANP